MPAAVLVPALATVGAGTAAAGAQIYSSSRAGRSQDRASQAQIAMNNRAAELEAKSAAEQLAFLREQEATRRREWQQTQDRNYGIYQEEQGRLAPYRSMGVGSLRQIARGLPRPSAGSLGARMRG